jgi:hypothetical protein
MSICESDWSFGNTLSGCDHVSTRDKTMAMDRINAPIVALCTVKLHSSTMHCEACYKTPTCINNKYMYHTCAYKYWCWTYHQHPCIIYITECLYEEFRLPIYQTCQAIFFGGGKADLWKSEMTSQSRKIVLCCFSMSNIQIIMTQIHMHMLQM